MIYTYFMVLIVLIVGGLSYFAYFLAFDLTLTSLEASNPAYYAGGGPDWIHAFLRYSPLFIILIPIVIYMIVQSQKPEGVYV